MPLPLFLRPAALLSALLLGLLCVLSATPARAFDDDYSQAINGTTLHFRVRGTDKSHPYLLVLHGGPGFSAHMFYPWGASLEKTVNVVYLDQRGSGQSARLHFANPYAPTPAEAKDYTLPALIADIEGVRTFLKVDKWYVLGHSWGGMLGLEYVDAHPEHVLGYIHMDGLVSVPAVQSSLLDKEEAKFTALPTTDPNRAALLAQVAQLRPLPTHNPMRLFGAFGLALGPAELYFAHNQATAFPAFNQKIAAALQPYSVPTTALTPATEPAAALIVTEHYLTRDDTPLLSKVTMPTLVINGEQDGVITPQMAQAAHVAINSSDLVLLTDCGHFPFAEQPEKTAAAVLAFLTYPAVASNLASVAPGAPVGNWAIPSLPRGFDTATVKRSCIVHVDVDATGAISHMSLKQSSGSSVFDKAGLDALAGMHFTPAYQDHIPHAVVYEKEYSVR